MNVLIQNCRTRLYAHANGQWTMDQAAAARFNSSLEALRFANQHKLPDAQIVIGFDGPRQKIIISVKAMARGKDDTKPDAEP